MVDTHKRLGTVINPLLHLTGTAVVFGLFMFALDLLTSTSLLQNRKVSTMFTLTFSIDGTDSDDVELFATYDDALADAIGSAHDLGFELGGLQTHGAGLVYELTADEFVLGPIIGTWSIVETNLTALDDTLESVSPDSDDDTMADAVAIVSDVFALDVVDVWDIADPEELERLVTESEIDGWSDDDDDLAAWLESVYSDPMERDDYEPEYIAGTWR